MSVEGKRRGWAQCSVNGTPDGGHKGAKRPLRGTPLYGLEERTCPTEVKSSGTKELPDGNSLSEPNRAETEWNGGCPRKGGEGRKIGVLGT